MTSITSQPGKRKKQINMLKSYLKNPGRFSILVLGDRGTGKTFWVNHIGKEVISFHASTAKSCKEFWEKQFELSHQKILLIEDIEQLNQLSQEVLFEGLSTQNGSFGYQDKNYEVTIVFTSSKKVSILRDSEKYLTNKFFDRIAQLVVEFPNFEQCGNSIIKDFKAIWGKFKFTTKYPNSIEPWLKNNAHNLHGNFRDLDKLCIVWNNYQLSDIDEDKILPIVKYDFQKFYRFPETKDENVYELVFSKEETYQDMLENFRREVKAWAKEEFPSLRAAAEVLKISHRTIERW